MSFNSPVWNSYYLIVTRIDYYNIKRVDVMKANNQITCVLNKNNPGKNKNKHVSLIFVELDPPFTKKFQAMNPFCF